MSEIASVGWFVLGMTFGSVITVFFIAICMAAREPLPEPTEHGPFNA